MLSINSENIVAFVFNLRYVLLISSLVNNNEHRLVCHFLQGNVNESTHSFDIRITMSVCLSVCCLLSVYYLSVVCLLSVYLSVVCPSVPLLSEVITSIFYSCHSLKECGQFSKAHLTMNMYIMNTCLLLRWECIR